MNDLRLHDVDMLYLLWLTPLLIGLYYYASRRRRQALRGFAQPTLLEQISRKVNLAARRWKAALVVAGFAVLVIGLARPAWNPIPQEVVRRGRDVVFLLDVSRSMLAEDLAPNRLERAKLAILDAIDRLEGDRVSLVAFAGSASVKCPLTLDYGFFRMALEDISPTSVARGGTMIGDSLRKVLQEVFDEQQSQYRDIVLITDGEDHESFPVEAAEAAGGRGIRLIAIGLGDENVGRRIPVSNSNGEIGFLKYKGEEVWSRLDANSLRQMAAATPGGRYLNVATGAIDFGDVYLQLIASAQRRDLESQMIERYEEKFQIFLGLAFMLLCVEIAISERKR